MKTILVGSRGERTAVAYLKSRGFKIYDRNVRLGRDEIDIIAYDRNKNQLVFVEVKTRSKYDPDFPPTMNLTRRKKAALKRSAWKWMYEKEYEGDFRIDLVCVISGSVTDHYRSVL